jgi:hypothetical protein
MKSPFLRSDNESMQKIHSLQTELLELAGIADAKILLDVEMLVTDISTRLLAVEESARARQMRELARWVSTIDHNSIHLDLINKALPNTGSWLRKNSEFKRWIRAGHLYLYYMAYWAAVKRCSHQPSLSSTSPSNAARSITHLSPTFTALDQEQTENAANL